MPLSPDDPWIAENSPMPAEKLHALGVVSYHWNTAEIGLKVILVTLMRLELATLWPLIHEMGDISVSDAIEEVVSASKMPQPVVDAILHGLKVYEANRLNRNQLTHFVPAVFTDEGLSRVKGPKFDPKPFLDSVDDLRRVADEIKVLIKYFDAVLAVIQTRRFSLKESGLFRSLPDIIPVPERLWKPLPPNPPERNGWPDKVQAEQPRPPSAPRLTEEEWLAKYRKEGRPLPDNSASE
jgi:hypothetical protein